MDIFVVGTIGFSITFIVTFLGLGFFGDFNIINIINIIKESPILFIISVFVYIFVGILWSFIKLALYAKNLNSEYLEEKEKYLKLHPSHTEEMWLNSSSYRFELNNISNCRDKIIKWSSFWVWSVIWTIINDPVLKIFKWIYITCFKLYESIYNKMTNAIYIDEIKYNTLKNPMTREEWEEKKR